MSVFSVGIRRHLSIAIYRLVHSYLYVVVVCIIMDYNTNIEFFHAEK